MWSLWFGVYGPGFGGLGLGFRVSGLSLFSFVVQRGTLGCYGTRWRAMPQKWSVQGLVSA